MAKKALLVGINKFSGRINSLQGCINDTLEMQEVLCSFYGFENDAIKILHDSEATSANIRAQLDWLKADAKSGDVLVFHFSSHGTQVPDDSGDEWECKDEVIVPYDHDWDHPFRDDDLRAIFAQIPDGVNFTFIADCCHSGTIQKDLLDNGIEFQPRYLTPPKRLRDAIDKKLAKRDADFIAWASEQIPAMLAGIPPEEQKQKAKGLMKKLVNTYRDNKYAMVVADRQVLLAACEDKQTAADAKIGSTYHGAFTWGLAKAIREANGQLTYGDLIKRIGANLQPYDQKPQLECTKKLRTLKLFAPLA